MGLIKGLMKKTMSGNDTASTSGARGGSNGDFELSAESLVAKTQKQRLSALREELIVRVKDIYPDALAYMVRGRR